MLAGVLTCRVTKLSSIFPEFKLSPVDNLNPSLMDVSIGLLNESILNFNWDVVGAERMLVRVSVRVIEL